MMDRQPKSPQRAVWRLAIWALGLVYGSLAFLFANFWPLFVVPAASFVLLQTVALGDWPGKETLFKLTDYIYYLLIGGFVALGSHFVLEAEHVKTLDVFLERQVLQQRLSHLDATLPDLRANAEQAQRSVEAIDQRFAAQCQAERFTQSLRRSDGTASPREVLRLDLCVGYFETLDAAVVLPHRVGSLERERAETDKRLKGLPSVSVSPESQITPVEHLELTFLWIPMLLLVGITIKLAKTTCSLWPVRKNAADAP